MRTKLSLDTGRIALLLIDFQEEQRRDPRYAVWNFDHVLANAGKLLNRARGMEQLIVHTAYRRDFSVCPPRPFEPLSTTGRPAFSDATDPLTAICREVAPLPSEVVICKNDASAFSEGSLQPLLKARKIEWLVIAGVWTEACVAASIRDAMVFGLRVLLVKDACGSGTGAMHQTAILNIANRLYGGAVADTQRAMDLMAGKESEPWVPERPVPILFSYEDAAEHYAAL
ncbi:MAG TPA: isochorismatase family protein [Aestuariivirgaceae bacterium]|nr:isochorismatase family protein [Aestuariivirgaceae bacterium]